jgi:hypothetical protein
MDDDTQNLQGGVSTTDVSTHTTISFSDAPRRLASYWLTSCASNQEVNSSRNLCKDELAGGKLAMSRGDKARMPDTAKEAFNQIAHAIRRMARAASRFAISSTRRSCSAGRDRAAVGLFKVLRQLTNDGRPAFNSATVFAMQD